MSLCLYRFGDFTQESFQPHELIARVRVFGVPEDQREVEPPERVANRGRHRVQIYQTAVEHLAHPNRTDAVAVLRPAIALDLVYPDHLLRDPVDVAEGDRGNPFVHIETQQRLEI